MMRTKTLTVAQAMIYGGLTVAALDFTYASVAAIIRGSTPARTWRFVASGLIGPSSMNGGIPTMLLGIAIHVFIACCVVAAFVIASRFVPMLARNPLIYGPIYGVLVFLFMFRIVIPLSAIGVTPAFVIPRSLFELLMHMFGIGLPAAWFASRVRSESAVVARA
jgi:hypothetical protein